MIFASETSCAMLNVVSLFCASCEFPIVRFRPRDNDKNGCRRRVFYACEFYYALKIAFLCCNYDHKSSFSRDVLESFKMLMGHGDELLRNAALIAWLGALQTVKTKSFLVIPSSISDILKNCLHLECARHENLFRIYHHS